MYLYICIKNNQIKIKIRKVRKLPKSHPRSQSQKKKWKRKHLLLRREGELLKFLNFSYDFDFDFNIFLRMLYKLNHLNFNKLIHI